MYTIIIIMIVVSHQCVSNRRGVVLGRVRDSSLSNFGISLAILSTGCCSPFQGKKRVSCNILAIGFITNFGL